MSTIEVSENKRTDREIAALAERHGTPLYVYDLVHLRKRISDLRRALYGAKATLFFATMANDRVPVLQLMAKRGLGACVNSIPHLALATECGFPDKSIQFTSTGVAGDDMRVLQKRGIKCNLDSLSQLKQWFELGGAEAGIRINACSIGRGLPRDRIGIDAEKANEAQAIANSFGRPLNGLHIYVGTNFQLPNEMLPTLEGFFDLAGTVEKLSYVNVGGGIGVNYRHDGPEFDIFGFGQELSVYAERLRDRLGRNVEVIVEPGRGLAADCGTFVTSVTDVKELAGRQFVTVDASIAVFPRPFHHPDCPHRVRQIGGEHAHKRESVNAEMIIVGRTTFSRDILGSIRPDCALRTGDLLALADAGAYSQSMASRFLGQREPETVFIDDK